MGVVNVSVAGCKIELFDKTNYETYAKTAPGWMTGIIKEYGENPYARLVEMGKLAQKAGVIKGILLHQGESNAGDKEWPAKVKAVYDNLIQGLDLKPEDVPLLAGELVNADQNGACAGMNEIIAELPKLIPNAYVISTAGCKARRDHLHFTAEGYRKLGKRYGEKMLSLLGYEVEKPKEPETPGPTTYCNPISLPDYPLGRRARDVTVGAPARAGLPGPSRRKTRFGHIARPKYEPARGTEWLPGQFGEVNSIVPIIPRISLTSYGQAWAGKSVENVGKSLIFHSNPCKMCKEWNS